MLVMCSDPENYMSVYADQNSASDSCVFDLKLQKEEMTYGNSGDVR